MSTTPLSSTDESLWGPDLRPVMTALMSIVAIVSYNNLSVSAALPDVGDDLGQIELLPWVITVELFTAAVAVLAAGPAVDGLGVRRTFRITAVGFAATSLLVTVAPSMHTLLAARAVQGVFAGAVMTAAMAGVGVSVPARLRPRAFAAISAVWGVMGVAGPALAATMVATVGWRGIFAANLPVTIVALLIGWGALPERQEGAARAPVDLIGLLIMALVTGAALSLTTGHAGVMIAGAIVFIASIAVYGTWAGRTPDPVVRIPHLVHERYRTVHLASIAVMGGAVGADAFLPLYVRAVRGGSQAVAAFSVLYLSIGWTASAWVSSRLQDRWPGEWVSLLGAVVAVPGAALVTFTVRIEAPMPVIYGSFVWLGAGVGLIVSTGAALLQNRTGLAEMGRVNGAHQFLRTIGITLGIAVVAAITFSVVDRRTGDVESVRDLLSDDSTVASVEVIDAVADGYSLALVVVVAIVAVTLPATLHLVRTRHQQLPSAT